MPFREDLDAAMAHAEVAERELLAAREQNAADQNRIAELEAKLANAQRGVERAKPNEQEDSDTQRAATRTIATFNAMHLTGGVMLLVFAVACLGSAIYLGVNGVTPSIMRHVRGLHASDTRSVIIFLVAIGALNGGIAVKLLIKRDGPPE